MAQILTFRGGEMRRDESASSPARTNAEVIVFPGVRYEHWDEACGQPEHQASAKKRSRDRRRDVLELAD